MKCPACGAKMHYSGADLNDCDACGYFEKTVTLEAIHASTAAQVAEVCAPLVEALAWIAALADTSESVLPDSKQKAIFDSAEKALAQHRARTKPEPHPLDIIKPADPTCRRCNGSGWYEPKNMGGIMLEPCRCRKEAQ